MTDNSFLTAGFKPVLDLIRKTGFLEKDILYYARDEQEARMRDLITKARKAGIELQKVGYSYLTKKIQNKNHQGILLIRNEPILLRTLDIDSIRKYDNVPALYVALDGIQDPANIGAIIRSMKAFDCSGLVVSDRRSAPLGATAMKTSAGTLAEMPVMYVAGIASFLYNIADDMIIIGSSLKGELLNRNLRDDIFMQAGNEGKNLLLVLGSEEKGIAQLVSERCHTLVRIPHSSNVESLNVSVAAGIILYAMRESN